MTTPRVARLAETLREAHACLWAVPIATDGEWIRRLASLLLTARADVAALLLELEADDEGEDGER